MTDELLGDEEIRRQILDGVGAMEQEIAKQIDRLRAVASDTMGSSAVSREIAILGAKSSELAARVQIASALPVIERLGLLQMTMRSVGDDGTRSMNRLTRWTRRLVWATYFLGAAALMAAVLQAVVILRELPQVIVIGKP